MVANDEGCLYVPWLATFSGCQGIVHKCTLLSCRLTTTCCFRTRYMPLNSLRCLCSCALQLSYWLTSHLTLLSLPLILHPVSPTPRPAPLCRTMILLLSESSCRPVCQYVTQPVAKFGLSAVFPYKLKYAFGFHVPALHLLLLVSLDQDLAHQIPLIRAVLPPSESPLFLNYRFLLHFP